MAKPSARAATESCQRDKRQEILKSQKFFRGEENIPSKEKNTEDEIPIHLPKEERQQGRTLVPMANSTSFPMAEST